jgi:hypothetical protein
LPLPAGAKELEAGKGCPFWKAWPRSSKGGHALLKLCGKGQCPSKAGQKGLEGITEGSDFLNTFAFLSVTASGVSDTETNYNYTTRYTSKI